MSEILSDYKELYNSQIRSKLNEKFAFSNVMQIPKLLKISVNIGLGKECVANSKAIDTAFSDLMMITGQKPVITKAKKSIAGFKLRQGQDIGCKVSLRGDKMYEFLFRLVHIALPRVKDFKGLSTKSFDGNGNYSLGIKEHIVFPEINYDKVDKMLGLDVSFITSTSSDEFALELLKLFNLPFKANQG